MKNFVQTGTNLTIVAAVALASGEGALIGALFGVAQGDAAVGDEIVICRCGVFDLPKVEAQAWAQGVKVYWDDAAKRCTTAASGNTLIGAAASAASNPSDVGRVLLDGVIR